MKSIKFLCMMLICSVVPTLWSCDDEDIKLPIPEPEEPELGLVWEDYKALVAEFPDAKNNFIEARYTLNNVISETAPEDIKATEVEIWCYYWSEQYGESEIFVLTHNLETDVKETIHFSADSPFTGDMHIDEVDMKLMKISLEDAIKLAKNTASQMEETDGLNTRNITLRKPLYPFWEHPQYVIGGTAGRTHHFFVDAVNGKVDVQESVVPEGSAMAILMEDFNVIADEYFANERMGYHLDVKWNLVKVEFEMNAAVNAEQLGMLEPAKITYTYHLPAAEEHPSMLITVVRNSLKYDEELVFTEELDVPDTWEEGEHFGPTYMEEIVDLYSAIEAVKLGPVTDTDTPIITLFQPIGQEHFVYRFKGENTPSVDVDGNTGELMQ